MAKDESVVEVKEEEGEGPQPLGQLITAFSRAATTEQASNLANDFLYISYANIMSQVTAHTIWGEVHLRLLP